MSTNNPISILNELELIKKLKITYEMLPDENFDVQSPSFTIQATVKKINNGVLDSTEVIGFGTARIKKEAKREAAKNVLEKLGSYERLCNEENKYHSFSPEINIKPKTIGKESKCNKPQELLQQKNLSPFYQLQPTEENASQVPKCKTRVTAGNIIAFGEGATYIEAIEETARNALKQFTELNITSNTKSDDAKDFHQNAVEKLNYIAVQSSLPAPKFEELVTSEDLTGRKKFTFQCTFGKLQTIATCKTRNEAIESCAFSMLDNLQKGKQEYSNRTNTQFDANRTANESSYIGSSAFIKNIMQKKLITYENLTKDICEEESYILENVLSALDLSYNIQFYRKPEKCNDKIVATITIDSTPNLVFTEIGTTKYNVLKKIIQKALNILCFICD